MPRLTTLVGGALGLLALLGGPSGARADTLTGLFDYQKKNCLSNDAGGLKFATCSYTGSTSPQWVISQTASGPISTQDGKTCWDAPAGAGKISTSTCNGAAAQSFQLLNVGWVTDTNAGNQQVAVYAIVSKLSNQCAQSAPDGGLIVAPCSSTAAQLNPGQIFVLNIQTTDFTATNDPSASSSGSVTKSTAFIVGMSIMAVAIGLFLFGGVVYCLRNRRSRPAQGAHRGGNAVGTRATKKGLVPLGSGVAARDTMLSRTTAAEPRMSLALPPGTAASSVYIPRSSPPSISQRSDLHQSWKSRPMSASTRHASMSTDPQHRVIYNYEKKLDDEVTLTAADLCFVEETFPDGWCKGTNVTTGESGVFPVVCLEKIDA